MKPRIKTAVFLLFMLVLFAPMIQQGTGFFSIRELIRQPDKTVYPVFTLSGWFSDEFQVLFGKATEEHVGFRPLLIRLKNQFEYAILGKANASGVVVGKKRWLYESDYIRAYTGRDFLGNYFWEQKFNRLKLVRDTLDKLGVRVAVVLEPGKATVYPQYIPGRYLRFRTDQTNYHAILKESDRIGLPLLDLNQYFLDIRDKAPAPVYPKGGIHWSNGGMVLAADTLLGFIQGRLGLEVPDLKVDHVVMSDTLRDTDGDVVEILNLLMDPEHPRMGYPVFSLEGNGIRERPKVLAISDSYYFNLLGAGIPRQAFANEAFWYYNNSIYPDTWSAPKDTSSVDIPATVEGMDLVLIMVTERFYHRFDWDFTDVLYRHYYPGSLPEYRYNYIRDILRNFSWFDDVQRQSDYSGIPMSETLNGHADYLFWEADLAGKIPHDLAYYRHNILKDKDWMVKIREKALLNKITVDEQLTLDAEWMLQDSRK